MTDSPHETMEYMVVRQDTNGVRYLVNGAIALTESEALDRIRSFDEQQSKPHKMDYFKLGYKRGKFAETLRLEEIHC